MDIDSKNHWEKVYNTKLPHEVSWTQAIPKTSLSFIKEANIEKDAPIIDIGGGDSNLVDFLINDGFTNVTVLDISEAAIDRAKERLGYKSQSIKWIVSDILDFKPEERYSFWHDRAAFHFLTSHSAVEKYIQIVSNAATSHVCIGTFSEKGPIKCSGLEIKQYSKESLSERFGQHFLKLRCINEDHRTPFDTLQNFTFCLFKSSTNSRM